MRAVDILHKKRHARELSPDEIAFLIDGFTEGAIPDYQISAFLMAVSLNGMTVNETRALTRTMLSSGVVLDLSDIPGVKVDKHSTGGVGDKTSLIIAPLTAAAGLRVPMLSGRGLGHSGGTLDKLESIPGYDVNLGEASFRRVIRDVGCAIIGQTEDIAPADRKLYALRDVTATIDSLPLITGSILSKKLAEGISGLVLDVKFGSGAFMKRLDDADALARLLLSTAEHMGKRSVALLTDMNQPLGTHVGNSLEVAESIGVLRGDVTNDLTDLSLSLTAYMLVLGGCASSVSEGRERAERELSTGRGLEKFEEMVRAQGGDLSRLPTASRRHAVRAARHGYVSAIDTESVGRAAMILGAGRKTMDDAIDPGAGLVVHAKLGDEVDHYSELVTIHYNDAARLAEAADLVTNAYAFAEAAPTPTRLIERVLGVEALKGSG